MKRALIATRRKIKRSLWARRQICLCARRRGGEAPVAPCSSQRNAPPKTKTDRGAQRVEHGQHASTLAQRLAPFAQQIVRPFRPPIERRARNRKKDFPVLFGGKSRGDQRSGAARGLDDHRPQRHARHDRRIAAWEVAAARLPFDRHFPEMTAPASTMRPSSGAASGGFGLAWPPAKNSDLVPVSSEAHGRAGRCRARGPTRRHSRPGRSPRARRSAMVRARAAEALREPTIATAGRCKIARRRAMQGSAARISIWRSAAG